MVEQLCWGTKTNEEEDEEEEDDELFDDDDNEDGKSSKKNREGKKSSKSKKIEEEEEEDEQEPLALLVVHAAMHMLFLPQFTCDFYEDTADTQPNGSGKGKKKGKHQAPEEQEEDKEMRLDAGLNINMIDEDGVNLQPKPASIVWCAGCGVSPDNPEFEGQTRKYDRNRLEVLRLLLSATSDPLYCAPEDYNPLVSRWLAITTAADAPNATCLFYSLLNTIMSFEPSNNVMMSADTATHLKLVETSVQLLIVLLDAGMPGSPEPTYSRSTGQECVDIENASKSGFNIFRTLLSRIRTRKELTFIFKGLSRLLRTSYEGKSGYVNTPAKLMNCHQELLILLWKMFEENPLFLQHVLTQMDVNEIVVPMCYLMFISRRDPARIGLVHICTFILLKLSGERSFGVNVNKPFTVKLPCDLPLFSGSHADLISIVLHKLIVNGAYKLVPLYSCFITIICNVSPYWRSISLVSSVKLVNLFELFSSPKFLYSSKTAYKQLSLLLEVFNNMIQYQYTGNQHLVYALIRRKDVFGRLASLNLSRAQSQCEKVYGAIDAQDSGNEDDEDSEESEVDNESKSDDDQTGNGTNNMNADSDKDDGFFMPNEAWISELKATLPMETVTRLLQHLIPVVDELCSQKNGVVDETEILEVLKDVTMVGLLPVPHAIVIRKYQPNQYTSLWFTAYLWGVIFSRNDAKIFDGEGVQLIQVGNTGTLIEQQQQQQ